MGQKDPKPFTLNAKHVARFWQKVNKGGYDECWPWLGLAAPTGYGIFSASDPPGHRRLLRAHRVAYFLVTGLQPEALLCHKCDNPSCCNPSHLFEGTNADNLADMRAKGRGAKGEAHGISKLTPEKVREIRRQWDVGGQTMKQIGKEFGVCAWTVHAVIHRVTWGHVD